MVLTPAGQKSNQFQQDLKMLVELYFSLMSGIKKM
jgi:hypothetical protein